MMNYNDLTPEQKKLVEGCHTPEELFALAKREGLKIPEEDLERIAGGQGWQLPDCPNCGSDKTYNNGSGYSCKACGNSWS
ncbi:MAG: hypothetical protein E7Z99_06140 [Coriobacteriaceae bacterium]|jgi:tRNA(Ile2) C34 agmatinyltransferase TiaS|nr:hypothetical protein [Coriobacteriaceae bacterium]